MSEEGMSSKYLDKANKFYEIGMKNLKFYLKNPKAYSLTTGVTMDNFKTLYEACLNLIESWQKENDTE